ncbi:MAG TPA: YqaA family protein [Caulobacteraceae bacterium]|nr:YqaA family protein [Caulobacteraceae bacterium]
MPRRLYDWVMRLSASPRAPFALAAIAFAESSFFPVPPDVLLAPMILARPGRVWGYAAICAGGSVIGGLLGYAIGYQLAPVGHWILSVTGHPGGDAPLRAAFAKWGVGVILLQGLLPIPYKLLTITSGLAHFTLWKFVGASIIVRSARFFGVAALVRRFGPAALPMIERRLVWVAGGLALLLVLVVAATRLLP